ncbi:MAG: hypothetical protein WCV41_01835, partial [Patescibacteria group bacterium]
MRNKAPARQKIIAIFITDKKSRRIYRRINNRTIALIIFFYPLLRRLGVSDKIINSLGRSP